MKRKTRRLIKVLKVLSVLAVLAVLAVHFGRKPTMEFLYPIKYEEHVTAYAAQNELPPSLVYAVIHTESHFNPDAVSKVGAKGLMQLMDSTYEWVQTKLPNEVEPLERVFDPEVNIRCGCKVLQIVMKQFDNVQTALAAYNAGSGNVSKWLKNADYSDDGVTLKEIPVEETRNYVEKVLRTQEQYKTLYGIE